MIFQHTIDKVLAGTKTETSRIVKPGDYYDEAQRIVFSGNGYPKYRLGNTYAVQRGRGQRAEARVQITAISQRDRRDISLAEAKKEGFDSVNEFLKTWCKMHDKPMYKPFCDFPVCNWANTLQDRPRDKYLAWVLTFKLV